jgi:hypothetical protein
MRVGCFVRSVGKRLRYFNLIMALPALKVLYHLHRTPEKDPESNTWKPRLLG